jgi:hypothetical protein
LPGKRTDRVSGPFAARSRGQKETDMKRLVTLTLIALLMTVSAVALAAERRHGVGLGVVAGTGEPEFAGADEIDFVGGQIFGKFGITDNWGVLITFRDMEDDEDVSGLSAEYTQISVHGIYMWRPDNKVRPHVKFGLQQTDLELTALTLTIDDDGSAFSFGGGFEAGSQKVAFFLDLDYTEVELFDVDFEGSNLTAGVIFKF